MIAALLIASQLPFIGLEEDRKAFEPYRQCVLQHVRALYSSRQSLKVILTKAEGQCVTEEAGATIEITGNAVERMLNPPKIEGHPGAPEERIRLFRDELFMEIADDFVPKASLNASN